MNTEKCLPNVKITKDSLTQQVRRHLRVAILDGTLKPGSKLPSVRTIAAQWGVTGRTIFSAIQALEKEGLLESYDRLGTYVRESVPPLKDVGIYYSDELVLGPDIVYPRVFYRLLKEELLSQELRLHFLVDPRTQEEEQTPWPRIVEACKRREIQGLILPPGGANSLHLPWLLKLPVPVAAVTWDRCPGGVVLDSADFVCKSLHSLAQQGCRSVGLITTDNPSPPPDRKSARSYLIPELVRATVAAMGMETREEWLCGDTGPEENPPIHKISSMRRFGREKFLELWSRREHPDGLVVGADDFSQGVFDGIQAKGVRVPEDLRVACLRNLEVPQPCPFPVTWIVTSMRDMARALIEQLQRQHRHEKTEQVLIGFREETSEDRESVVSEWTEVHAQAEAVLV